MCSFCLGWRGGGEAGHCLCTRTYTHFCRVCDAFDLYRHYSSDFTQWRVDCVLGWGTVEVCIV